MKIRPLPGTDLARIAVQEPAFQKPALELMKLKGPPFSYISFRRNVPDILNVQPGPMFTASPTEWHIIEASIRRSAKSDDEYNANIRVAKALHEYALSRDIRGRRQEFYPLAVGKNAKLEYWSPAVLNFEGRPTVIFVDPRKTKSLTPEARRFVFSVMNERIRLADPAYQEVALGIIQFDSPKIGPRTIRLHLSDDVTLFGFEELDSMIRQTYQIWEEVLAERAAVSRKETGIGPLFGAA